MNERLDGWVGAQTDGLLTHLADIRDPLGRVSTQHIRPSDQGLLWALLGTPVLESLTGYQVYEWQMGLLKRLKRRKKL